MSACPICRSPPEGQQPSSGCPLQPTWSETTTMDYLFSSPNDGEPLDPHVASFWSDAIHHYLVNRKSLSFTFTELQKAYRRGVVVAHSIERTLVELETKSAVVPASVLPKGSLGSPPRERFPVIRWVIRVARGWLGDDDDGSLVVTTSLDLAQPRVHVGLVQEAAQEVVSFLQRQPEMDRVLSLESWLDGHHSRQLLSWHVACREAGKASNSGIGPMLAQLSEQDSRLLLDYMVGAGMAARDGDVVKVFPSGSNRRTNTLTDADKAAVKLRTEVTKLESVLEKRQEVTEEVKRRCLASKKSGKLELAKMYLVRYKHLEQMLARQRSALTNLEMCLDKLHEMQWNVSVVEATKVATEALSKSREQSGLSEQAIDAVREALQDELDEHKLISESLVTPVEGGAVVDEDELAQELKALEEEVVGGAAGGQVPTTATSTTASLIDSLPDLSKISLSDVSEQRAGQPAAKTKASLPIANP